MPEERLQKLLARAGVASRRQSEAYIEQGRVMVNGQRASLGDKADPARDEILFDGSPLRLEDVAPVYVLLNKPPGIVSTTEAQPQEERRTVIDLLPADLGRLYPVGRLDADSEGLILLTNDGDLTQRLTHPRHGHVRTYRVFVLGKVEEEKLERWRKGVKLEDGKTMRCEVSVTERVPDGAWLEVKLREGRKRQIRRTASALNLHVRRLIRTHFGPLELGTLEPGQWRPLSDEEVALLKQGTRSGGTRSRSRGQSGAAEEASASLDGDEAATESPQPSGSRRKPSSRKPGSGSGGFSSGRSGGKPRPDRKPSHKPGAKRPTGTPHRGKKP